MGGQVNKWVNFYCIIKCTDPHLHIFTVSAPLHFRFLMTGKRSANTDEDDSPGTFLSAAVIESAGAQEKPTPLSAPPFASQSAVTEKGSSCPVTKQHPRQGQFMISVRD